MKRALFPLPVFLLPQGYTRLRIFEPRYLHMVKVAMKEEHGFVMCFTDKSRECEVSEQGIYVEIVDFSQDESGQLLIDVYAKHRVLISNATSDEMKLRHGDCHIIQEPLWTLGESEELTYHERLADLLRDLFVVNAELNDLYKKKNYANPIWVAARWLELLPLTIKQKTKIQSCRSYVGVANVLAEIFEAQE
ncbi:LON peptidase substrate-binding domain-containing protein [Pseudoalteromonas luteoviolacea]|uniref:LON peptidase substrate-binding domain-containing protein n=1 Tax=Pseudoalteromonas luteoviolacea TaxID=43657 RepID=UPI001B38B080|nr:LON peptidase substrate-binding domain-containing protein [Pseudoalteromonas luteoviolacea]MBQ4810663.1 LON peptidase substrate-binding domain-containing protein [Pseudoalteromonas luteoviolacea]